MKVNICSGDVYYRLGWAVLISSVPLTHVDCSGEILIFDLYTPGDLSNVNLKNVCHIIFLSNYSYALELLDIKNPGLDIYYLERNLNIEKYYRYLSNLILMIMQRKCYWKGVSTATNNKSISKTLTSREQQIILLALKPIKYTEIASTLKIDIKTVSTHKVNAVSKLRIHDHAQFAELARQTSIISELHNSHKKIVNNLRLSSANICRNISFSI